MSCPPSLKTVCVEILEGQRGPQGLQGIQGIQGPSGPVGASGVSIKGDTGEPSTIAGATGATGLAGASIKGDSGERGEKGSTGQQGIQGIQGLQGLQGNVGATGSTGPAGAVGASGMSIIGSTGATGAQGASGPASTVSGPQGATGATGLNAALTFNYRIDLSGEQTLEAEPLHQEIRFAGGVDPTTATHLLVNKNSLNLSALGSLFLSFEEGTLFLTSQSQPNTFVAYTFSQVQNGEGLFSTYVVFQIAMISQFNALADDDLISFGIALKGDTGATGAAQSFAWDLTTSSGTALTTLSINGFSTADIPALYHVSIDGINQHADAYTLSSGVLTFIEAVDAAAKVEIKRPKLI